MRVVRIYHSAVVDEYRQRERLLRQVYGHDVHVVLPPRWSEGGQLVAASPDPDVPVHITGVRGPARPNLFWYESAELRRILAETDPEIVDLHEEPYSLAVAKALHDIAHAAPSARVCLYTAQNLPKRYPPPFNWLETRALARAVAAYPCSTQAAERLQARGFRGSLHVMPLGVTVLHDPHRAPGEPRVGFVGRLEPYKGATLALEAFERVARDFKASLEIMGAGSELEVLRRRVHDAGLDDRVRFTGALPQTVTLEHIARLDIVLVPSLTTPKWKEQFGRVAAEAMASGTAVIASDSGSLREVVGDGGILVPEGDVEALAAELRTLLMSPELVSEVAMRGYERAKRRLSWERVAQLVDEMYRQVQ